MCHTVIHQFEHDADFMSDKVRLCSGHGGTGLGLHTFPSVPWETTITKKERIKKKKKSTSIIDWNTVYPIFQLVKWNEQAQVHSVVFNSSHWAHSSLFTSVAWAIIYIFIYLFPREVQQQWQWRVSAVKAECLVSPQSVETLRPHDVLPLCIDSVYLDLKCFEDQKLRATWPQVLQTAAEAVRAPAICWSTADHFRVIRKHLHISHKQRLSLRLFGNE